MSQLSSQLTPYVPDVHYASEILKFCEIRTLISTYILHYYVTMYQSHFLLDLIKTVYQMLNYEMKLELGVVVLNNELAIFQAKKPSQSNKIN